MSVIQRAIRLRILSSLASRRSIMTTSIPKPAQQPQQIQPTPTEEIFFGHLNDFVREGRLRVEPEIPVTECRIAGGWVRDKVSQFRAVLLTQSHTDRILLGNSSAAGVTITRPGCHPFFLCRISLCSSVCQLPAFCPLGRVYRDHLYRQGVCQPRTK